MDFNEIEGKWQAAWQKAALFESEPAKKGKKKFITAAFPYPNSPQHIGHARTYTTTDIYARYLRLRGNNVLFPMAFHVTGTPIIAMAKRIANGDEEIYGIFEKIYGIPREKTKTLGEPHALVMHFSREIEEGMREMGYSIDWRRKFYSFDEKFNLFIQWQFRKLKELGYIVQGEHPVAYCPTDKQAVGGHDTKGDADPEIEEFTAIKFAFEDGHIVTATLRPETIYGVSAVWVNPRSKIAKVEADGAILYVSRQAAEKLSLQGKSVKILKEIEGKSLVNKTCKNPETGESIPLLPADFVDPDNATGVVMSVPAHAPYDFLAIRDYAPKDYGKYLRQVLAISDYGNYPAKEIVEKMGIGSHNDERTEEATKEIYRKEAHTGIMLVGKYKGERALEAKEKIKADLISSKKAFSFYEISNSPVYCRCGAQVIARILGNQWFIDYSKKEWKDGAKACLGEMGIVPEKTRSEYLYAIDWFRQKACSRSQGLGTKFPFDETLVIEALSDSTIYMAFYTFAHMLEGFGGKELDEAFFDYVLLGKGKPKSKRAEKLRKSFLYWYPLDSRHSGADLVRNHLPFFIFNHVAIFPKEHWPKQIVTNGFVLMEGKKMSKSLANILPLRKAVGEYGADVIRFSVVSGADLTQDTDFNRSVADGTNTRLAFIAELVEKAAEELPGNSLQLFSKGKKIAVEKKHSAKEMKSIDRWLLSRLNRKIRKAHALYEQIKLREVALEIFYDLFNDLHWYLKRTDEPKLKEFFLKWCILINPFMPHVSEEFHSMLGGKGFASAAQFPKADEKLIDEKAEKQEELVKTVLEDVEKIASLVIKDKTQSLKEANIFVAAAWKKKLHGIIRDEKAFDKIMKACSQDAELRTKMNDVQRIAKQLAKNAYSLGEVLSQEEELEALAHAKAFYESEFKCKVSIVKEEEAKDEKAKIALPSKPAIKLVL